MQSNTSSNKNVIILLLIIFLIGTIITIIIESIKLKNNTCPTCTSCQGASDLCPGAGYILPSACATYTSCQGASDLCPGAGYTLTSNCVTACATTERAYCSSALDKTCPTLLRSQVGIITEGTTNAQGCYLKVDQTDGNLVLYNSKNNAVWFPSSFRTTTGTHLDMQPDGNLVLYDTATGNAKWSSSTSSTSPNPPYTALVQDDCNFVIYDKNGKGIWSSGTNGKSFT